MSEYGIVSGSTDCIFILISISIGVKIILKYFNHKEISLITVGLAWITFSMSFMAGAVNFISYAYFNVILDRRIFLILALGFTPFALIFWLFSVFTFVYSTYRKKIIIVYSIFFTIFEFILFYLIFNNPEEIGVFYEKLYFRPYPIFTAYYVFLLLNMLVSGILLIRESLKSEKKKIQWQGRFLIIAFLSLICSIVIEGIVILPIPWLIIVRIFFVSSAFEYYLAFFLPEKLANILIKKEK